MREFFKSRKTLFNLVTLVVLVVALPIGISLVRQQQILRSRAQVSAIEVTEGDCVEERDGKKVLICSEVPLKLTSPIGGVQGSKVKKSPKPSPTQTPKASPSLKPLPPGCNFNTKLPDGRPILNVKNFNNDIQTTLDCFKDNATGGGAVFVPAGNYKVTDKIRVFSNVTLFGDGIDKTILQLDDPLLTDPGGILGNDTNYGHKNIAVRDMTLRGLFKESNLFNCCPGILLRQLDGGFLYNLKVEGFSWHGIHLAYKKQTTGSLDAVEHVRISNCQILNNKGSGIAIDSPQSNNVVDNCTLSGNNSGADDTKKNGAAVHLFMDEDGLVTKNKILNNTITNNSFRGISLVARNNITAIKTTKIFNNAVCNNTVENNKGEGIVDGNSEENKYIANKINNNNDKRDGKVQTGSLQFWDYGTLTYFTTPLGSSLKMTEDESPTATNNDCKIPPELQNSPPAPPKPIASTNNFSLVKTAFAQATPSATPDNEVYTTSFKLAESEAGLKSAEELNYSEEPTIYNYELTDDKPGIKQIWVEFTNSEDRKFRGKINVELAEEDPQIDEVSCRLDISSENVVFEISGKRFGKLEGSKLTSENSILQLLQWQENSILAILEKPNLSSSSQRFNLRLTRADGQESEVVPCSVGLAQLSLGTEIFCKELGKQETAGVNVIFVSETGEKALETSSIDSSGVMDFKTKLEAGKKYLVSVKPPGGLRRNAQFRASTGTAVVKSVDGEKFVIPIGDIAPSAGDGAINSADRVELAKQWIDTSKNLSGDFNQDGKVNSIDWACMRHGFGEVDEPLPNLIP